MQETGKDQVPISEAAPQSKQLGKANSKPGKQSISIWRRIFRFFLVMLIVFGLGAVTVIFTLYIPQRQRLQSAQSRIEDLSSQNQSDLQAANEEIDRLTSIENQFDASRSQLTEMELQNLVLKIKLDVITAKLALVSDDPVQAGAVLSETTSRISDLEDLLGSQETKNIDNLKARLELVLKEIEDDTFAAISDLEVMLDILENLDQ